MEEKKPAQVIHLFGDRNKLAGRDVVTRKHSSAPKLSVKGDGSVGVMGDNNNVNINVRVPAKGSALQVQVQPGEGHITDEQAYEISRLVAKVAELSGRDYRFVWSTLKRKFIFTKYQLLPPEKYEAVRTYLRKWIASSARGVAAPPTADRKRALARIHAESKKVPSLSNEVHRYIESHFGVQSLADLTLEQLIAVIKAFRL